MQRPLVLCRNEGVEIGGDPWTGQAPERVGACRDNYLSSNPRPMRLVGEITSAWMYHCDTCGWRRAWDKRLIGGTVGVGRRADNTGPSTGKGPDRYRPGVQFG